MKKKGRKVKSTRQRRQRARKNVSERAEGEGVCERTVKLQEPQHAHPPPGVDLINKLKQYHTCK